MKNIKPTDSELEILQLLWQHGPLSVRTINEMLNELSGNNSIGYTTTLKIMQIMYEKGILKRNTDQRSHIYLSLIHISTQSTPKGIIGPRKQ